MAEIALIATDLVVIGRGRLIEQCTVNDFIAAPESAVRLILSYFGHYGVQIFIFLSAYGLTKSFTALAILQLRDAGRLTLDDPAERYVPELKALRYPTSDAPRTISPAA